MTQLVDIRDSVDLAKHFVVGAYLACQAPTLPVSERRALCAVLNAAREQLEAAGGALDRIGQPGINKPSANASSSSIDARRRRSP